jgi:hypothetical protein
MSYDDSGWGTRRRWHVTPYSLILLAIFVGAFGLMVYLAVYKPGFGDDSSATPTPVAAETVPPAGETPVSEIPPGELAPGP